jgi:hypothetical protein
VCVALEDGVPEWEPVSSLSTRIEILKTELARIKNDSEQDVNFILEELEKLAD